MSRRTLLTVAMACAAGGGVLVHASSRATELAGLANDASWRGGSSSAARTWLAGGPVPGGGASKGLAGQALLDLHGLLRPNGALLAGPVGTWASVWPREASCGAAALAAAGRTEDAWRVLRFLSQVQLGDGGFAARYRPDGSRVDDAQQRPADGAGWALWALDRARAEAGGSLPEDLVAMRDRAVAFIAEQTRGATELPPPSPDYWEEPEGPVTLGTVAPLATGLEAATRMYAAEGNYAAAQRWSAGAERLRGLIVRDFGPVYERHGSRGGLDAAVAMLLPPFAPPPSSEVLVAWLRYASEARRPAGGLAPGTEWTRDEGVSWTAETALVAYTAAATGRGRVARAWLDWLAAHRAPWGSMPERVLPDGLPAGPAPLAWTAALVVLTEHELDRA